MSSMGLKKGGASTWCYMWVIAKREVRVGSIECSDVLAELAWVERQLEPSCWRFRVLRKSDRRIISLRK